MAFEFLHLVQACRVHWCMIVTRCLACLFFEVPVFVYLACLFVNYGIGELGLVAKWGHCGVVSVLSVSGGVSMRLVD